MSFSPEMLRSRLTGSTEAADSITSTAHWILFHKRHAGAIAEEWAASVSEGQNKLPQIYIANEVIQQSKLKKKAEFVDAFSTVLPKTLADAYLNSDLPTRDRIMRVIRVWRDRVIFTPEAQQSIEDAVKSAGQSLSSVSVPEDLTAFVRLYSTLKDAVESGKPAVDRLVSDVKAEMDRIHAKVDELAATTPKSAVSPEVEPLPKHSDSAPQVEVYTAQHARASAENATSNNTNDEEEIAYADDDDDEKNSDQTAVPPEKKQKVSTGVDPKLASFLASISSNQ